MNLPSYFLADLPPEASLNATLVAEACQTLKRNRAHYLAHRSTQDVIDLLSSLANEWRQPEYPFRKLAIDQSPAATGFSAATLVAGLDAFFGRLTAEHLEALIEQELGHTRRLDQFVATPVAQQSRRAARATGPPLLVHVASGNLPDPALMSIVLGMLVRSAQFVKCATGGALLPRLFAHSLYETDSKFGACLEIAEWQGGRTELEAALYSNADCVTATGSDETLADIRARVPSPIRFLGYGHRVSFGYVAREALTHDGGKRIAARAALDVAAWNQLGCLSPHLFYVESGGGLAPDEFAEALAHELAARESIERRGLISGEAAAAITSRRALYEIRAAVSDDTRQWKSDGSTAWTVVYEADAGFQMSCLNRFVYVKPVAHLSEALRAAEPVRGKVSTVGLEAVGDRAQQIASELADWGVMRICPLGQMQRPPLSWHHDGRPCLGDLVTWTDWER